MKLEEMIKLGHLNGAMCTDVSSDKEDNPTRISTEAEKIITRSKSNSYIVIGKDRMGDVYSGFGGKGFPNSNSIDIVVGMGNTKKTRSLTKDDAVDPNPFGDSARIYISQRTDLDSHFGINEGEIYKFDSKQGVSGAAMKADTVLVLGRRNVKIKAGQSHGEGFGISGEKDSLGAKLPDARIDLIADAPLEPMVRGEKLVECVKGIYDQIQGNRLLISNLLVQILKMRIALMAHVHPAAGVITFPSPDLIGSNVAEIPNDLQELTSTITDMISAAIEELNCVILPNKHKYILSKNVFSS